MLLLTFFITALGMAAATETSAPSAASASPQEVEEIVITATRTPERAFDVPQPVMIVGADDVSLATRGTWAEGLRGLPGLALQRTSPGQGNAIVRGLKGSEVLHLVDGFRLNMAIFRNAPNNYLGLVDPLAVERIEVARGASSALYGSDAMGGVVELSTGEPKLATAGWHVGGRLRASAASADRAMQGRAAIALSAPKVALLAGGTWQNIGRLRTGDGVLQPHTAYRAHGGNAKLRLAPAAGHDVILGVSYFEQPKTPRYDQLVAGFGQSEPEYEKFFFAPGSRLFAFARYRLDARGSVLFDRSELAVAHQSIRDDRLSQPYGGTYDERERNASRLVVAGAHLEKKLNEAGKLLYGLEATRDEVTSTRTRRSLTTGATEARTPRFPDGATQQSLALYAAHDLRPNEWIDVNAGLRASWYRADVPELPERPSVRVTPFDLSGHAAASLGLGEHVRWVARVGRGFRAPNIFDLGIFGSRPGNRFSIPNPELEPETVWTYDLGLRARYGRFSGEAFAFRADYDDKILEIDTGTVTTTGQRVVQGRNVARVRYYGVEAAVSFAWTDTLSTRATSSWVHGTEHLGGASSPAERVPPLGVTASLRWQPWPALGLEAIGDFVARQDRLATRDREDPRIDPAGTDGYGLLGLLLDYDPTDDIQITVRADNVTDARYREHGSGIDGAGFNLVLALDWRV